MHNTKTPPTKKGRPAGQSRSEIQLVGYLRKESLLRQMKALVEEGVIGHFWAVQHEPDEDAKKEHWHIRMFPPVSRTVDWNAVIERVQENVPGETLPRKLVASSRATNDKTEDGLLYARHDRRYCDRKGLVKSRYDYPRTDFFTDDEDWLDGLWALSDQFTPAAKRMSAEDLANLVEAKPETTDRTLLRLCLVNGHSSGTLNMLLRLRDIAYADRRARCRTDEEQLLPKSLEQELIEELEGKMP